MATGQCLLCGPIKCRSCNKEKSIGNYRKTKSGRALTSLCEPCEIKDSRERVLIIREQRVKNGLCVGCGEHPRLSRRKTCNFCAAKSNRRNREVRADYIRLGLCFCGNKPLEKGKKTCARCLKNSQLQRERSWEIGVCGSCKNRNVKGPGYKNCSMCIKNAAARKRQSTLLNKLPKPKVFSIENLEIPVIRGPV